MAPDAPRNFDVFLSYAREDEARVVGVEQALESRGLAVWRDRGQIRPGDLWMKRLEAGLRESHCTIYFHSQMAATSEWVQREWNAAFTLHMPIIPVRLDESELPLLLKPIQSVNFFAGDGLEAAAAEIVLGVRGGHVEPPPVGPGNANPSALGPDVKILDRMIGREAQAASGLQLARWVAGGAGLAILGAVAAFGGGTGALWTGTMAVGTVIVTGAVAWAITSQIRSNQSEVLRLSTIKDGIELYCPNQPSCVEFRVRLETILKRRAGIEATSP